MDQIKIGKFIAQCRKEKNMTQMQLAEKLNITDRAVSKWENGKAMPDSSIMLELCGMLGISVNDLLSGEVVTVNHYDEKMEKNLLEIVRQKEEADKRLLSLEVVIVSAALVVMLALGMIARLVQMEEWLRYVLILIGFLPILVLMPFMIRIEQKAGYYQCAKCGHKYIPRYSSVLWAMHMGRTRYMKCPVCGKHSWNKKVLKK